METTLAYLAGALDADGYFTIARKVRTVGDRYGHRPTYYTAKVGFTGTINDTVQLLLKELFDGSVGRHQPKTPGYKPWTTWSVSDQKAGIVAAALRPYLRMKHRQADLLVEFCAVTARQWELIKATQVPPYRLTSEIVAERERYWREVTHLNSPRNRRKHFLESGGSSDLPESAPA